MIPDLKMGMMDALFSSFGKIPCDSDRLMTCIKRRFMKSLLSLMSTVGKLSYPAEHNLRRSMIFAISSSVQGAKNMLYVQFFLMNDNGSVRVDGIFLSRESPIEVK